MGQSVDLGNRWVQHLKRMVGAEEPTGIVLYKTAKRVGVENLRWECLEKCGREVLSEREKWWGNFYAARETGLNVKLG